MLYDEKKPLKEFVISKLSKKQIEGTRLLTLCLGFFCKIGMYK